MGSYLEHFTGDDPGKRDRLMKGLDVFFRTGSGSSTFRSAQQGE